MLAFCRNMEIKNNWWTCLLFLCIFRWTAVVLRLRCGCLLKTALFPGPERSRNFQLVLRGSFSMEAPKTAAFSGYQSLSETVGRSCCTTCSPRKGAWDTAQKVWLQISCANCSFYCIPNTNPKIWRTVCVPMVFAFERKSRKRVQLTFTLKVLPKSTENQICILNDFLLL